MHKPALYVKNSVAAKIDAEYTLKKHIDLVKTKDNYLVADVGCGPGNITFEKILPLLPKSSKLIGFDLSPDHIEYARNHYQNDVRVSYHQLDITTELIPRKYVGRFNLVTSFFCFHFIGEQRKAIDNIHKIVQTGGTILITFMTKSCFYDLYHYLYNLKWKNFMKDLESSVSQPQSAQYYKAVYEDCGFQNIVCEDEERRCYVPEKTMFDILDALSSFNIPEELKTEFVEAQLEYLQRRGLVSYDAEGGRLYDFSYNLTTITAVKS